MKSPFTQICVWPGTIIGDSTVEDFEKFMKDEFDLRVKYLESVTTFPDKDEYGVPVPETGGREDIMFVIHHEDVPKFIIPRLMTGIKWWCDFVPNEGKDIYPQEVLDRYADGVDFMAAREKEKEKVSN